MSLRSQRRQSRQYKVTKMNLQLKVLVSEVVESEVASTIR